MERSLVSQLKEKLTKLIGGEIILLASVFVFFSCQPASEPNIRTIPAATLADKYGVSVEAARREFDGTDLIVEGYVQKFAAMPDDDEQEGMVLLGSETGAARGVECWFTRYESLEFGNVEPGNLITVKGTFNGEAGPLLKFCKLVKTRH